MLPKKSTGPMPTNIQKPEGTKQKTTHEGPHGGGNKYHQAKISNEFMVHKPIIGHTQKNNLK